MKKLKGNLHTHTTFSDGHKSLDEVVEIYRSLKYDFIAITDHDFLLNDEYFKKLSFEFDDLIVFAGVEISEPLLGGQHIGLITGDKLSLRILNHPSLYGLSVEDILNQIEILGPKYRIDCIDVSHYGDYMPMYDTDAIPLPKIVSDDAHRDGMFGKAWIEVVAKPSKDDILRNIKKGNFTKHFKDDPT